MSSTRDAPVTAAPPPAPASDPAVLDDVAWHSLAGSHRAYAQRVGVAARYDPTVSVFAALDGDDTGAWRDLAELAAGEPVSLLRRAAVVPPDGWQRLGGGLAHQMVVHELSPAPAPAGVRDLGPADAAHMMALVEETRPGPFTLRTVELGDYVGVFEGGRLVAMAGTRMAPPGFREVSAVCTHPDARGRGYAAGLTTLVAERILARGERPFLHHSADNPARRVYEALGFEFRVETAWTVLARA